MINISTGTPLKLLNKNLGGKNVNQNIGGYNIDQNAGKNNPVKKWGRRGFNPHVGKKFGIKNVFKPTINIGDLSNPGGTSNTGGASNTGGSSTQQGTGKSPTININLIINLLCACTGLNGGQNSSPTDGSGNNNGNGNGPTTGTGRKPRTIRRRRRTSPLLNKLSPQDRKLARGLNLKEKGPDGKPKYLIGKGKDGKDRLYQQKEPGKYRPVGSAPDGSRKLKPKNVTTDQHGVSQAGSGSKTSSPLILDTNKDGKVSAQHGIGVDVNGDNRADGAAVGGDKMLTMGDRNGNGKIDGTEVFGDKTVDPFTNKPINAKNGFEALRKVALSAQQATGINIVDPNGKVNVQKLNQALQSAKKGQLGMISGNNTTKPEALGDVASIDTQGYKEQAATGNVQHRQLGSYTDTQGGQHKVNDVWFKHA